MSVSCDMGKVLGTETTTADISGVVYESGGFSQRLPGVKIFLVGRETITASDGSYSLENIPVGQQELTATKNGYQTHTYTVKISGDANVNNWHSFQMRLLGK